MKRLTKIIMRTTILKIAILSLLIASCDNYESTAQYSYLPPDTINDGFEMGTLETVDMDVKLLEKVINEIYDAKIKGMHSMLIYKDGMLVFEEYFQGHKYQWDAPYHNGEWVTWNRDTNHHLHSASKSVTSCCIGIAIDNGFIENVNQSIFDYLPDHQHLKTGGREKITIEHILTMTSGLEWEEWSSTYSSWDNPCLAIWVDEKDPISYILEKPLIDEPGTAFNYNTGHMNILGEIIRNASGMDFAEFSGKYLFEPLEIDKAEWVRIFDNGVYDGNSMMATPREMMKFGVTFLNNGVWNGKRIISEEWVAKSAAFHGDNKGINVPGEASGRLGYSYTWWTKQYGISGQQFRMYAAGGFGGQHIMVFPELDMVVVFTAGNYYSKRPNYKILEKYIIPAVL